MILLLVWVYLRLSPTTIIICGHWRLASQIAIPVLTPKARASYDEVVTTVRPPPPTTAIGFPFSAGSAACSTEAKKAFISKCIQTRFSLVDGCFCGERIGNMVIL